MHLWLFALLAGGVEIEGATTCPTGAEVAERLRALVPDLNVRNPDRALLRGDGRGLRIDLVDPGGSTLATRKLLPAGCADLAQAAAVVIAAWESELRPPPAESVRALPPPLPPRRAAVDLAGAFIASFAGASFAPGGGASALVGVQRGRVWGRIAAAGFATRDLALGPGHASWTRAFASLGVAVRFRPSRFIIDLHGDALAALLYVKGIGYMSPSESYDVDPGLGVGARAAVRLGPVALFLGGDVAGWLRAQTVRVLAQNGTTAGLADLPRVEALLSAGLAWGSDYR